MGIVHVRIDERLIHGQVANTWTNSLGITRIMVIDDGAAKDDVVKMSLKLATPSGVALSVLSTARAVERILAGAYKGQRVMVIAKKVETVVALVKNGVRLEKVNLGNVSYREGKTKVSTYVSLSQAEFQDLLWLRDQGVNSTIQLIPTSTEENFSEGIEQYLK